ncbi:hypothetical protein ACFO4N_12710 [Camelliibacillus cellulosilyticus]|uniref:Uncharacterized protein n=1 Tax=Camelliibacillus cellulosilyticus TaxID=2174486 RepID=A0ABV9GQR2_9BACL
METAEAEKQRVYYWLREAQPTKLKRDRSLNTTLKEQAAVRVR